jgi:gas vesicle protein
MEAAMNYDEERSDSSSSGMAFVTGLMAGAVIGAGVGLLFAPRKGSEMREQVSDAASNFGKAVSKTADDVVQRGRTFYDRARDVASRTAADVQSNITGQNTGVNEGSGRDMSTPRQGGAYGS